MALFVPKSVWRAWLLVGQLSSRSAGACRTTTSIPSLTTISSWRTTFRGCRRSWTQSAPPSTRPWEFRPDHDVCRRNLRSGAGKVRPWELEDQCNRCGAPLMSTSTWVWAGLELSHWTENPGLLNPKIRILQGLCKIHNCDFRIFWTLRV